MPASNHESSPEMSEDLDDLIESTLKEMDGMRSEGARAADGRSKSLFDG